MIDETRFNPVSITHVGNGIYQLLCHNCRKTTQKEDYGDGIWFQSIALFAKTHESCKD